MIKINNKAELIVEYALVLGIVATALFSMQAYMKRGDTGVIKSTADNLAAPVMEYSQIKDPQLAGIVEKGLVEYKIETTPTVTAEKNIVLTETIADALNEPSRTTVINKDETHVNGKWSVVYNAGEDASFTALEKRKGDSGVSPLQAQPGVTPAGADTK